MITFVGILRDNFEIDVVKFIAPQQVEQIYESSYVRDTKLIEAIDREDALDKARKHFIS